MDNQLIDEALSLYNYLRLHVYKEIIYTDDRERVDKLVLRAFYRFERRKLLKNHHKFNPSRNPTRAQDWDSIFPVYLTALEQSHTRE
ncbi:MAG: hypothetical protein WC856_03400 [Methylococcaceae bacterium]